MKDLDFEKFGKFICNLVSRVGSFFDAKWTMDLNNEKNRIIFDGIFCIRRV